MVGGWMVNQIQSDAFIYENQKRFASSAAWELSLWSDNIRLLFRRRKSGTYCIRTAGVLSGPVMSME
jgi:hypothetical protein